MVKVHTDKFPAGTQGTQTPGYYMDGYLQSNLDILRKIIKDDWDCVIAIDGMEGAGKSVLAMQMAYYCDPTFNLERVAFVPDEFKKAVLSAEPYTSVLFDEAFGGLASRRAMSAVNFSLVDMLTEIRQKNLFVFIVLPTFFDLDKYVALWRSRALVHVYADKFQRGSFKFYNYAKKKEMYVRGKKFYSYCVEPNFRGSYPNFYTLDKVKYKAQKLASLRAHKPVEQREYKPSIIRETEEKFVSKLREDGIKIPKIAAYIGRTPKTVYEHLKNLNIPAITA